MREYLANSGLILPCIDTETLNLQQWVTTDSSQLKDLGVLFSSGPFNVEKHITGFLIFYVLVLPLPSFSLLGW